jgi:ribosome-associated protein
MPASKINDPAQDETIHPVPGSRPSKTQRKKQSHARQSLGERLVDLTPSKLAMVPLPEKLREAVEMAQRTRSHEGRRRQMQYVGKLMRDADADAIAQVLAADSEHHRGVVTAMHAAERWRDGLIDASLALTAFIDRYPAGAAVPLAALVSAARRERDADKAPRQSRVLYRELHRIIAEHELDPPHVQS